MCIHVHSTGNCTCTMYIMYMTCIMLLLITYMYMFCITFFLSLLVPSPPPLPPSLPFLPPLPSSLPPPPSLPLQAYISSADKQFAAATIQSIGRVACNISEVTETCLHGLTSLLSHKSGEEENRTAFVAFVFVWLQLVEHKGTLCFIYLLVHVHCIVILNVYMYNKFDYT